MKRRDFLTTTAAGALAPLALTAGLPSAAPAQLANPKADEFRRRTLPITAEERLGRIEAARALMKEQGMDALLFEGGPSLSYFTGVGWGRSERLFAMLLPLSGDPVYVAPRFEEARAREQTGEKAAMRVWQEHESPYALIKGILSDIGALSGVLGVEETTRWFVTDNLSKFCPALNYVSGTAVTAGCRSVKSAHEIELMRVANDILAEVYKAAVPQLREGMTEREFAAIISKLFGEYGVGGGALVLFGDASALPHGHEHPNTLGENQIVLIDGGCSVEGYNSDVTRTTVFGKPTDKMKSVFDIVKKAQTAARTAAKPGVPAEQVDFAARRVIVGAGYGPDYRYFTHRVGHGIGLEGHEWYYLVPGNKRALRAANIFSDEPGIYIPGEFGIRLEDELLITENGSTLLLPQAESFEKMF